MQLIGHTVQHKQFGCGVIANQKGQILTIDFEQGQKKFLYPDAFIQFLTLNDKETQKEITSKYNQSVKEEKEKNRRKQEIREHEEHLRNIKITKNSQAVFNVREDEVSDIMSSGRISTGVYLSGYSKGEPKVPNRMKPNSLCLITCLPSDGTEKDRYIAGAFMVSDKFYGDKCSDGIVKSHDLYKLTLPCENRLHYWNYIEHGEKIQNWGSSSFKYIDNIYAQNILENIKKLFSGKNNEDLADKFYEYFCMINHL